MPTSNKTTRGLPNLVLQEERLIRGWTQQEVANRVGTTVVNVSRWERGVTLPNPYFRQKLCALFEKEAKDLGLLAIKQVPQSEPSLTTEGITPALPEKEFVAASNEIAPLPQWKRLLGERRTLFATLSIALVLFVSGSGFLIHSFVFTQSGFPIGTTPAPTLANNIIAEDTFHRANQTFWGKASDGLQWEGGANTAKNFFSITNNTAHITSTSTSTGINYDAIIGPKVRDSEVLFTGSLSQFTDTNLGSTLRWQDTNRWYKAYITGSDLIIQKRTDATSQTFLRSFPFAAKAGLLYTIRFQAVGTLLMAKVWLETRKEPANWMITAHDELYKEGFCGLRIRVGFGATATVTSFQATSLHNAS